MIHTTLRHIRTLLNFIFQVSDIEKALMDVRASKIRTLGEKTKIGAHGKPVMFLHPKDCNGVLVELEET